MLFYPTENCRPLLSLYTLVHPPPVPLDVPPTPREIFMDPEWQDGQKQADT